MHWGSAKRMEAHLQQTLKLHHPCSGYEDLGRHVGMIPDIVPVIGRFIRWLPLMSHMQAFTDCGV
jgi:hypothetical protein